ncbi:MAG: hypothetical protein AUJ92_03340 [Armatimonadetes bacterium CG2_30_59_28]|nr:sensor domain-containing diguanylate cyclase [Armatimonadota bacterium]OIO97579.1 MAG: hypothetical protein AUJ92_03340 [Armatimonadetes bacterium CG2_30_59_28]PIU65143.1 MAG: hypothetical protein COS85_09925 [Armatimonadetes bacterium CG07_land_8_20_14_0_80_59_28]PIX39145.1 MAG: hypothetical protein COZ56_18505 [Armatimonadetes bacterium CG_4_8_14_3_um_filter_58_9]PIY39267.1 MAG: hypothetical protein COZ05_19475 [Armatimonadetes bacterium CG_4_10_14_3_um_filter_59_10]
MPGHQQRAQNLAIIFSLIAVALGGVGFFVPSLTIRYMVIGGLVALSILASFIFALLVFELTKKAREAESTVHKARSESISAQRQKKELSERFGRTKFLGDLFRTISGSNDLAAVLDETLDQTMTYFGAKSGFVMLVDEEAMELYVERALARDGQPISTGRLPVGEGVIGYVAATGIPRAIQAAKQLPGRYQSLSQSSPKPAMICAPLKIELKTIGVMTVEDKEHDENFSDGDLEFLSLIAAETGIAIEKARLYERMEQMSVTDGLTGVANRRCFDTRIREEALKARRYNLPLSVIMLDIDHFKTFNDTYGHAVGDEVLKSLAITLKENVRETDFVARYGGEEFVIVSPDCDSDRATGTAERLREIVESISVWGNSEHPNLSVTISLGVGNMPEDSSTEESLVKAADDALYYSKENGRNRVTLRRNMQVR